MRVIEARVEDGLLGCCTEKCYEASSSKEACRCVCGGKNHGRGEQYALEHAQENAASFGVGVKVRIDPRHNQLFLWSTKKDIESQSDR